MTAAETIIAIATTATMMSIFFFLFLGDFSEEGDRDDNKRSGAVKQYNTKEIEYNRYWRAVCMNSYPIWVQWLCPSRHKVQIVKIA